MRMPLLPSDSEAREAPDIQLYQYYILLRIFFPRAHKNFLDQQLLQEI